MNVLFLTIGRFESIEAHSIYADLLRCFRNRGHEIYVITPSEKRTGKKSERLEENGAHILHIETGDVTGGSNLIRKGLAQISVESVFIRAIKACFSDVKFDLILYTTPPITFANVVRYVKKRDGAASYLLLKDIFPQNAVDLGMMKKRGVKGIIYRYFRAKEKKLYALSDHIGCMSQANVAYVLEHNPEIPPEKVEICPNSIALTADRFSPEQKRALREKYHLPADKTVFIYGGNLGRPQDIPFIMECLRANKGFEDRFFVICGTGAEYPKLRDFAEKEKPGNFLLINGLPREEYENFVGCCDIGLIFLDHRFTIPNFPSRLLSYMQNRMPVLACTDPNTDIGKVIEEGGFGWWCESSAAENFTKTVNKALASDLASLGEKAFEYLKENYTDEKGCDIILRSCNR